MSDAMSDSCVTTALPLALPLLPLLPPAAADGGTGPMPRTRRAGASRRRRASAADRPVDRPWPARPCARRRATRSTRP
jgi:hypothetical protein